MKKLQFFYVVRSLSYKKKKKDIVFTTQQKEHYSHAIRKAFEYDEMAPRSGPSALHAGSLDFIPGTEQSPSTTR